MFGGVLAIAEFLYSNSSFTFIYIYIYILLKPVIFFFRCAWTNVCHSSKGVNRKRFCGLLVSTAGDRSGQLLGGSCQRTIRHERCIRLRQATRTFELEIEFIYCVPWPSQSFESYDDATRGTKFHCPVAARRQTDVEEGMRPCGDVRSSSSAWKAAFGIRMPGGRRLIRGRQWIETKTTSLFVYPRYLTSVEVWASWYPMVKN